MVEVLHERRHAAERAVGDRVLVERLRAVLEELDERVQGAVDAAGALDGGRDELARADLAQAHQLRELDGVVRGVLVEVHARATLADDSRRRGGSRLLVLRPSRLTAGKEQHGEQVERAGPPRPERVVRQRRPPGARQRALLAKIVAEDGVSGGTSNPSIFAKAVEDSDLYDARDRGGSPRRHGAGDLRARRRDRHPSRVRPHASLLRGPAVATASSRSRSRRHSPSSATGPCDGRTRSMTSSTART